MINVVNNADCLGNLICQNPEFASSFEDTCAPWSWANVCSTEGSMCLSLRILWFNLVKLTHIHPVRTFPLLFGTTTIPAHHSVGSSTLQITPNSCIHLSSCSTLDLSGMGILLGVASAYCLASGFKMILYSPSIVPRPWNSSECWSRMVCLFKSIVLIMLTKCRAVMAGQPIKGLHSPLTTNMSWSAELSPFVRAPLNCPWRFLTRTN